MLRLYGFWRSSCSYRVRLALGLKGIAYENVPVHLVGGEHTHAAFLAHNPQAQVPVIDHDGFVLGQSVAIFEYLEEVFPDPPLWPADRSLRARARQLTEVINAGVQPLQNLYVTRMLEADYGAPPRAERWSTHHIARGLDAFARIAEPVAARHCVGDSPTFVDCALVPQLFNARRYAMDVETRWPLLAAIDAHCAELDAFSAAHPRRQPDAPAAEG